MNAGNNTLHSEKLDFDYWASLAERDPDGFERLRAKVIADLIAASPEHTRQRLRGLQWRIDRTRERSSNALGACVAVSRMMWDTYERLNQTLRQITRAGAAGGPTTPPPSATVLRFRSPAAVEHIDGQG